jgi:predicted O-linked N-acetylglucosamine transferase (SPINDLY family)
MTRRQRPRPAKPTLAKQAAVPASADLDALLQEAVAHHRTGHLSQAEAIYRRILQFAPDHPDALHLLGVIANQAGKYQLARELIARSLQINPRNAAAYNNHGYTFFELRQYEAALKCYDKAIRIKPDYAEAHNNRSHALKELGQYRPALESCEEAIRLKPDDAEAYVDHGNLLHAMHRSQAALESYDKAIGIKPDYAEAYSNRGGILNELHRYQEALESYAAAIRLKPELAEAYNNRGTTLLELHRYQAACESYGKAILLKPEYAEAYVNRGNALHGLHQYQLALDDFDKAMVLRPDYEYLPGMQLHMKRFLFDWKHIEDQCHRLEEQIALEKRVAQPLIALFMSNSPALQKKAAEICVRNRYPACSAVPARRTSRHDKIRVGYFSADFCEHPVSYLTAELFEQHDRSQFEIFGFSFGPETKDKMRARISTAMDRFLDLQSLSDQDIAQLSRELEVDIAVDLMGFTTGSRTGIFAQRAAPIQINYLGYPGTMGAGFIDYLIADRTLIPDSSRQHYTEKIVYLPDCFQVNDSRQRIADTPFTRAGEGLPEQRFVFCCFNNNYKIAPRTFDRWMRILHRVEGSVLWLRGEDPQGCGNLRKEAERRGISSQRLIFARFLPLEEHTARQKLADLFLDTLPFNAGATASSALWAGLPVLTCMGEAFAGRMAASLLRALDLPELVTSTEEDYEALAVEIALHPKKLQTIKERLRQNLLTAPLFNTKSFTGHLEAAYSTMYERHRAGLPPDHIYI